MKKSTLIATLATVFALMAVPVGAQDNETSYFLDNNLFGYRFNPSTVPYRTSGFFMVGAGNVAATTDMNIGVSNFLFKLNDGSLVNGFNSAVSYDEFITPLPNRIGIGADINENILSIASTGKKGGFRNFEVNLVTKDHFSLDKNLLAALKSNDGSTGTFTAKDITASSQNYLEIAIGGSKRLASFLGFGVRAKGLVGLADVNVNINEMSLTPDTGTGDLLVSGKGSFTAAAKPVNIPVSGGYYNFLGVGRGAIAPAGLGLALDAGATIYFWQDKIQIGAAVHDLGFMNWTTDKYGKMDYTAQAVSTSGGANGVVTDLFKFAPESKAEESVRTTFPMYYTASVKFKPINIITLGALADIVSDESGKMTPIMRYGVAFTPFRQFNVAGSYTNVDGLQSVGLAASLRLLGISVTAGIDSFLSSEESGMFQGLKPMTFMPKYYLPIQPVNTTFNVGVALAFGMSKERWSEVTKVKAKTKKAKTKEKEESLEDFEKEKPMTKAEAKKAAKEQAKADAAAAKAQAEAEAAAAKEQAKAQAAAEKAAAKEQAKAEKKAAKEAEKQAKKAGKTAVEAAGTVAEGAAAATGVAATETAGAAATAVSAEQAAAQKAIEEAQAARAAAEKAKAEAEAELKAIQEKAAADKAAAEAKAAEEAAAQAKAAAEAEAAIEAARQEAEAQAQEAIKAAQQAQEAQAAAQAKAAAEAEAAAQAAADKAAAEAAEIAKKAAEEAAAEKAAAEAAAKAAAEKAAAEAAKAAPMTEEEARAAAIAQAEAEAKAAEEEAARAAAEAEAALNGTAAPAAPQTPATPAQ